MGYYLEDHPNPNFGQYGWPRTKISGAFGVHTTESGVITAGDDPGAENTAAFISRRTDPGSYHGIADWDSRIRTVSPRYAAWADITNNAHALSVSGAMDAARWRDLSPERAAGIVRNMGILAAEIVRDAIAQGLLDAPVPARRITAAEAIAGTKAGFYGHGETNPGTRYDPGQNFDWELFLSSYASAIGGSINYQSTSTSEEDDELKTEDIERIINEINIANEEKHKTTRDAVKAVAGQVIGQRFQSIGTNGKANGETTIGNVLGAHDANVVLTRGVVTGAAEAVAKTVAAINPGTGIDPEEQGRRAAAAFLAAIDGLHLGVISPTEEAR